MRKVTPTNKKITLKIHTLIMMIRYSTVMKAKNNHLFLWKKMSISFKNMACSSVVPVTISCNRTEPNQNFFNSDAGDVETKISTSKTESDKSVLFTANRFNTVKNTFNLRF